MMGYYGGSGFGLGGSFFGGILTLAFWVLVIWAVVAFVRSTSKQDGSVGHKRSSAMDILEERFAKGEISKEEFEERRKVLKGM